jgi:hypothetical protein
MPCGFGVAVDHQWADDTNALASIFVTDDEGEHWIKREPKPQLPFFWAGSWPVGQFASMALPAAGRIALAWEDPWLLDRPNSHVISSQDRGESWQYSQLGGTNPYLALDHAGRILALNNGYYLESHDGGIGWQRRDFQIDWPDGYDKKRVSLLRDVTFTESEIGYALVVHWLANSRNEVPPTVGLVGTSDNGLQWSHIHVFEGPNIGHVNERHILSLRVACSALVC